MKLITWNVNGIRAIVKKDFFSDFNSLEWDVLCLQETKAQVHEVKASLEPMVDLHIIANEADRKGYSGTAMICKKAPLDVSLDMGKKEHDSEGRVICAEFDNFYLVNVYVPNSGSQLVRLPYRKEWDADFLAYLKEKESRKPVVVCGDFNVSHKPIDLTNDKANYNKTAGYTQVEIDGMTNLLDAGFVDVFRHLNPDTVAYTYWSYRMKARERNVGWRLDYFLASRSLLDNIRTIDILTNIYGSDHCPVSLEIEK